MAKIFISYRREDAGFAVDQVHAALKSYAETPTDIFIDVDNIPPGADFVEHLASKVSQCEIMLVAIGLRWLDATNESGKQRLSDPDDFVRIEIESALARGIPVVPVLIGGAPMPNMSDLPESLHPLLRRQAVKIERGNVQQSVDEMMRRMGLEKAGAASLAKPEKGNRRLGLYALAGAVLIGIAGTLLWQSDGLTTLFASSGISSNSEPEAARALREDCNTGVLEACTGLGFRYENGEGVPVDFDEAVQLYRKACDGGHSMGCNNLGYYHQIGRVVDMNPTESVRLYRIACVGGEILGCKNLEKTYQDIGNARQACDGGNMKECTYLGYEYEQGNRLPEDFNKAIELYRTACNGGNPTGCNNLGYYYELGRVVQKDDAEALRLYRIACDGKETLGCNNLENLRANGGGGVGDVK
ncbi:MAG: toll/interleukin-1 receptor domain-containing protein [Pseudomonadota bacterium]